MASEAPLPRPLALSDAQLAAVRLACEPLLPVDRDAFLRALVQLLGGEAEIGDGTVARAIRSLQREFWRPPLSPGGNPLPAAPIRTEQTNNDAASPHVVAAGE
jgi:hypothetical protein